jgi:predicted anti-sigma-YlaC factor YlaD
MRPRTAAGLVVVILATGVAVTLAGAVLIAALQGRALSEQGATMLSTMVGAIIGAIAGYIGGAHEAQRKRPDDEEPR